MRQLGHWIAAHPLRDWRYPAAVAVALFMALVLLAFSGTIRTKNDALHALHDNQTLTLCRLDLQADFEKAVGHVITVDRTNTAEVQRAVAAVDRTTVALEHTAELCRP